MYKDEIRLVKGENRLAWDVIVEIGVWKKVQDVNSMNVKVRSEIEGESLTKNHNYSPLTVRIYKGDFKNFSTDKCF